MAEKTILIIDDEKEFRNTIEMMLGVAGQFKIVMACDGKEGIKQAHMVNPDLILLDIKMPELDGIETLKILKENNTTMKIPVIMLTACEEDVLKIKASQLYDEDYITKPVKTNELVDRVQKVLKRTEIE